jgi:hypothetical protein
LGVGRDHQRAFPGADVITPGFVEQVEQELPVPTLDAAVFGVGVCCVGPAVTQVEGRGSFPFEPEPSDVM